MHNVTHLLYPLCDDTLRWLLGTGISWATHQRSQRAPSNSDVLKFCKFAHVDVISGICDRSKF